MGCRPVPPERDLAGEDLAAGTGIENAHLTGAHLRLPGYGESGPTLEIFSYEILGERGRTAVDQPGFGHSAFAVDEVGAAHKAMLRAG